MALVSHAHVSRVTVAGTTEVPDLLAIEEPLEIRLGYGPETARQQRSIAVTMRTPGQVDNDAELALGFLFTEGIIQQRAQVLSARHCVSEADKGGNVLRVELQPDVVIDWHLLERHSYTASSCGICGKTSIEAVRTVCPAPLQPLFTPSATLILSLPDQLTLAQVAFAHTGGLHAAALFDGQGHLSLLREDVGRHNALDKVIGASFWTDRLPLSQQGVFISSRIGFELVQKCWMAGISVLAAVGAPTSLAVDLAREAGISLIGFVRNGRFNVY